MDMHRETIRAGIAEIEWEELKYFYARGQVILVSKDLDLEETAYQICMNNTEFVEKSMVEEKLMRMPDAKAKEWFETQLKVLSVVIQPWVLVQSL